MLRVLLRLLGGLHRWMLLEAVLKLSRSHTGSSSRRSHLLHPSRTSSHRHGRCLGRMSRVLLSLHAARSGRAWESLVLKVRGGGDVVTSSGGCVLSLNGSSGLGHPLLLLLLQLLLLSSSCRLRLLDLVSGHGLLVKLLMPLQHLVLLNLRLRRLLLLDLLSMCLAQADDAHSLGSNDLSVWRLGVLRHGDGHSRRAGLTGLHEVGNLGVS